MLRSFKKKRNESDAEYMHRITDTVLDLIQRGFFIVVAILVLYLFFGG